MSKKRKKPPGTTKKSPSSHQTSPAGRTIEGLMRDLQRALAEQEFSSIDEANTYLEDLIAAGGPPVTEARTPLEEAQELIYQAVEASGKKRLQLARRALRISEDCADAYVLLAEEAESVHEARALYEQGVRAAERALGPETFEQDAGHFWGLLETRPYMRARAGLARCLEHLGRFEEAAGHYRELLALNPDDNQGVRYALAQLLLDQGDDEALRELLERFEDDGTAAWCYTRTLLRFRRAGPEAAAAALQEALDINPHVPPFLLGKKRLPRQLPALIGWGDESEAVAYAAAARRAWRASDGALTWLESATGGG